MQVDITEIKFNDQVDPQECKGLVYRGKMNKFLNSKDEFLYQQRMVPMKRMSCSGCVHCGFIKEDLDERICNQDFSMMPEKIKHGALYRLEAIHLSRDWESGIVDDWDLEFIEMEKSNV